MSSIMQIIGMLPFTGFSNCPFPNSAVKHSNSSNNNSHNRSRDSNSRRNSNSHNSSNNSHNSRRGSSRSQLCSEDLCPAVYIGKDSQLEILLLCDLTTSESYKINRWLDPPPPIQAYGRQGQIRVRIPARCSRNQH